MPTRDILYDLRKNLQKFGVADAVQIIEGWAAMPPVISRVRDSLGGRQIGLMFVDADGDLPHTFAAYGPYLADDCLLVIDDYLDLGHASGKSAIIQPLVDEFVQRAVLRPFMVSQYGTLFGQVKSMAGLNDLPPVPSVIIKEGGACYVINFWSDFPPDTMECPVQSALQLFEDGAPLGPAHSPHVDIRRVGRGRYSHWGCTSECSNGLWRGALYFSTSDCTDPRTNGRTYSLLLQDKLVDLRHIF